MDGGLVIFLLLLHQAVFWASEKRVLAYKLCMKEKSVQLAQADVAADIPDDLLRPGFFCSSFYSFSLCPSVNISQS